MEYRYRAVDKAGVIQAGMRSATGVDQLSAILRDEGLIPLEVRESSRPMELHIFSGISPKERLTFTQQLAGLLQAGIRLSRSLEIVAELSRGSMKAVVQGIRRDIQEGRAFSVALEKHPKVFDPVFVTMVRAGEASGQLPQVLARMAESIEAEQEFTGEILTSLIYPGLVTAVSVISLILLMTLIIPQFEELFRRQGQDLPWITRLVVSLSHAVTRYGWMTLGAFAVVIGVGLAHLQTAAGRLAGNRLLFKLPVLGELLLKVEMERLTRLVGLLMASGVNLLHGLTVVSRALRNPVLAEIMTEAAEAVRGGNGLSRFLAGRSFFPSLATAMIGVGEEGGNLGPMMEQVARIYARETRQAFKRLSSLVGPILILVLTGVIFLIALAILLPIFQIRF